MDNYLQQGIMAAKSGDRPRAFDLLTRASESPATSEQAWLWLSGVVNDDSERLFCLDSVLRINSDNAAAQRGAAMLRQKGVFPAIPVYPEPQRTVPVQDFTSRQILSPPIVSGGFCDTGADPNGICAHCNIFFTAPIQLRNRLEEAGTFGLFSICSDGTVE